jgi:hypothetical protein
VLIDFTLTHPVKLLKRSPGNCCPGDRTGNNPEIGLWWPEREHLKTKKKSGLIKLKNFKAINFTIKLVKTIFQ